MKKANVEKDEIKKDETGKERVTGSVKGAGNGVTELVFILDRSGSMAGLESDTIGGFNGMIEKQKKNRSKALVSTVLFDNESRVLHDRVPLEEIGKMTEEDYTVGGCTALLDAIGGAIKHISKVHKYIRPEDVPEHTMFVITTDGMENASRKYDSDEVKKMISRQKESAGWEFLFIGANIDAVETASRFGIGRDRAVNYRADKKGTKVLYEAVGAAVANLCAEKSIAPDWSRKIEEDFEKRKRS